MTDRIDTAAEREKLAALEGHTPGPWRATLIDSDLNKEAALRRGIIKKGEYFGYAVCPDPWDGLSIALMPACDADHSEDAELVAAAPDLKDTLSAALDEIDRLREALDQAILDEKMRMMAWCGKRQGTSTRAWLRAARKALSGDMSDLRTRVALAEAGPLQITLSGETNND